MKIKYYIIPVWSGFDPEPLKGPYQTFTGMKRAARKIHANQREDDAIFWLRIDGEYPIVGAFSSGELGERQ